MGTALMLTLYSEPYNATGSIDARAARRALGLTRMGFWDLFLREVLQNSWDARLYSKGTITFTVDAYRLTDHQHRILDEQIFRQVPSQGLPLGDVLRTGAASMLVVTDSGTRGLGGPTRADVQPTGGERTDFVDFVRNIGRAADKGIGGGTYGFGKGVLFEASKARTILAYSRTTVAGNPVTRLIGMALGDDYNQDGKRYTGRHWWGVRSADSGVSPLVGRQAEEIASGLRMNRLRSYQTGTAVAVICPEEPDKPSSIIEQIVQASVRWAWPHMISDGGAPSIQFEFTDNDIEIQLPDLARDPRLRHYVEAYKKAEESLNGITADDWPWTQKPINAERPRRTLGAVAYRRYISPVSVNTGFSPSGVALMRGPRFVVKYMPLSRGSQDEDIIGVFIAAPDLDEEFAQAETVAHDDWLPSRLQLARYERNPVKQALDKLKTEFQAWRNVGPTPGTGEERVSVTRLSAALGSLLQGRAGGDAAVPGPLGQQVHGYGSAGSSGGSTTGDRGQQARSGSGTGGAMGSGSGGGGASPRSRPSVAGSAWVTGPPVLQLHNGRIWARFDVIAKIGTMPTIVEAVPRIVLDSGSAEDDGEAPLGADTPKVAGWSEEAAHRYVSAQSICIAGEGEHRLQVDIQQPTDTMIALALRTRPAE